jgi:AraC family transcriptional regulator
MEKQNIRIINLPALRVASFYAFSASPEMDAWEKMVVWAKAHSCWHEPPATRIFGFNNPDPSIGSPNYGYEYWLSLGPDVQSDSELQVKEFSGGLYGVLHCDVSEGDPYEIIPSTWGELVRWLESSHYKPGNHQCLEEHLTRFDSNDKGFVLDLYIHITE